MVELLENGDYSDEFYDSIEARFFNPFTCSPLCILYGNGIYLIEISYEYDKLRKHAVAQTIGVDLRFEEDSLSKIEVINEYESYLSAMDNVLNMIVEKQDKIDILLYLKQNVL